MQGVATKEGNHILNTIFWCFFVKKLNDIECNESIGLMGNAKMVWDICFTLHLSLYSTNPSRRF